jgi:hypothetical protein
MIMTAAAATGSSSFLSHPELCDDLDAQPLTLSGHGDLDDFDFLLDIDEDDAIAASAYNSEDGIIMDIPFRCSTRSTTTARFETMDESSSSSSSSLNGTMHFHTIEETGSSSGGSSSGRSAEEREEMLPLPSYSSNGNSGYYQPGRDRGRQQQEHFRVNHQVNFDPPMQEQRYRQAGSLPRCQASVSDMSACSHSTAHSSTAFSHHDRYQPGHHDAAVAASHRSSSFAHSTTEAPRQDQQQHLQQRPANPVRRQHRHYLQQQAQQQQQQQCRSAEKSLQLQKLAESMRRTERSRKRVMMHRDSMSAEQRSMQLRALREMKEAQQRRQYHQVQNHQAQNHHQAQQREQEQQQGQHQMMMQQQQRRTSRSPDAGDGCDNHQQQQQQQHIANRSSIVTAFFSGSRSTLTNGLEHSRRQLGLLYHMSTI